MIGQAAEIRALLMDQAPDRSRLDPILLQFINKLHIPKRIGFFAEERIKPASAPNVRPERQNGEAFPPRNQLLVQLIVFLLDCNKALNLFHLGQTSS